MKFLLLMFISSSVFAEFSYQGQIELRRTVFDSDDNSTTYDEQNSIYSKLNSSYESDSLRFNLAGFVRFDSMDKSRKVSNLDETYFKYSHNDFSISFGNHVFNWSVLEFFHPVDTINARNLDVNAERIERLGLNSIVLNKDFENSNLSLFYLLDNSNPIIPKQSNRNGFGLELTDPKYVQIDNSISNSPKYDQFGIRYKHSFDNFDLDIHWFKKVAINNPFIAIPVQVITDPTNIDISPFYFPAKQLGATIQYIYGDYLFKFETIDLNFNSLEVDTLIPISAAPGIIASSIKPVDHNQTAIGLEYTHIYNSKQEGTFFAEYQFLLNTSFDEAKRLNPFQRDIGLGYRHNFNDFNSNAFVIAIIHDIQTGNETLYNLEHSFSFQKSYKMILNMRIIDAPSADSIKNATGLKPLRDADNFSIAISRYF